MPSSMTMGIPYVALVAAEEEAVFHCEKSDHLGNRLAARDHHEEREQDDSERDADRMPRDGCGEQADGLREAKGEDYQHQPDEHGERDVDQVLVVPLGSKALISLCRIKGRAMTLRISVSAAE